MINENEHFRDLVYDEFNVMGFSGGYKFVFVTGSGYYKDIVIVWLLFEDYASPNGLFPCDVCGERPIGEMDMVFAVADFSVLIVERDMFPTYIYNDSLYDHMFCYRCIERDSDIIHSLLGVEDVIFKSLIREYMDIINRYSMDYNGEIDV